MNADAAQQRVDRFVERFGAGYRPLAQYAALPLVMTPELLHYLRTTFLRGQIPWIAEADLLLSDLFDTVGYEQFAMKPDVRACLVVEARKQLGESRLREAARLLLRYVQHAQRSGARRDPEQVQAEQWSAMALLPDQRDQAARQLAESLREGLAPDGEFTDPDHASGNQAELARLGRIAEQLAPQLAEYPELVRYARDVARWVSGEGATPATDHEEADGSVEGMVVVGVNLPPILGGPLELRWEEETIDSDAEQVTTIAAEPVSVYISFSRMDGNMLSLLLDELEPLRHDGMIRVSFGEDSISASEGLTPDAAFSLEEAQIVLLLVSPHFLDSEYCQDEAQRALKRQPSQVRRVVPVLLRPCDWWSQPYREIQVLPADTTPISEWDSFDDAYRHVVQGIQRLVEFVRHEISIQSGEPAARSDVAADEQFDACISYSHRDKAWVWERLLPELDRTGLKIAIDRRSFLPGLTMTENMIRYVELSDRMIVVLSPDWVNSPNRESDSLLMMRARASGSGALIPVLLRSCEIPSFLRDLKYVDFSEARTTERAMQELLGALGKDSEIAPTDDINSTGNDDAESRADIYVSFATIDNEPSPGTDQRWVDTLIEMLQRRLAQLLGHHNTVITHAERGLEGDPSLRETCHNILRGSRFLLVILSRDYLASDWCRWELDTFRELHGTSPSSSYFVATSNKYREQLDELNAFDSVPYLFWKEDTAAGHTSRLEPADEFSFREYDSNIYRLAQDLLEAIRRSSVEDQDVVSARSTEADVRATVMQDQPERTTEIVRIRPTEEQQGMSDEYTKRVAQIAAKRHLTEMDLLRLQKCLLNARMAANSTFLVDKEEPGHSSKLERLAELLEQLIAEPDRKIVLFSEWTTMLGLIEPIFQRLGADFVRLDGKVPQKKRKEYVHRFQNDPECRAIIMSNAGSTGLNLQAANTVINVDLPWNPAILEQRIARAHRMGQKRHVHVYLLVTEDTMEERLLGTLSAKHDLTLAALDANSDVSEVEQRGGIDELKRRLERLLGEKPTTSVDVSLQRSVEAGTQQIAARREKVAAAAGELLGAAIKRLPTVFLDDATEDVRIERRRIEGLLAQLGVQILDSTTIGASAEPAQDALLSEVSKADLFIQLLGRLPGYLPPESSKSLKDQLYDHAIQSGLLVLRWRPPELTPEDVPDRIYRGILFDSPVLATDLDEFARIVQERVMQLMGIEADDEDDGGDLEPTVCLLAAEGSLSEAQTVGQVLAENGCTYWLCSDLDSPAEQRREIEQGMEYTDTIAVFLDDRSSAEWARHRLLAIHKLEYGLDRSPPSVLLIDARRAESKGIALGIRLARMVEIDASERLDAQTLRPLIEAARSAARQRGKSVSDAPDEELQSTQVPDERLLLLYSHDDESWLEAFRKILEPMLGEHQVQAVPVDERSPDSLEVELFDQWRNTRLVVLLVAEGFMGSEFMKSFGSSKLAAILDDPLSAMQLFWVPIVPHVHLETPLAQHRSLSDPDQPLDLRRGFDRSDAIHFVCHQIKKRLDEADD